LSAPPSPISIKIIYFKIFMENFIIPAQSIYGVSKPINFHNVTYSGLIKIFIGNSLINHIGLIKLIFLVGWFKISSKFSTLNLLPLNMIIPIHDRLIVQIKLNFIISSHVLILLIPFLVNYIVLVYDTWLIKHLTNISMLFLTTFLDIPLYWLNKA